jgi:hypothetical protein
LTLRSSASFACVSIGLDRLAQPGEQAVEAADVVVDLRREHAGFADGLRDRRRLIAPPSDPDARPDQDGEWNDGGDHQSEVAIECCAAPASPRRRNLPADPTAIALRGRADRQQIYVCTPGLA